MGREMNGRKRSVRPRRAAFLHAPDSGIPIGLRVMTMPVGLGALRVIRREERRSVNGRDALFLHAPIQSVRPGVSTKWAKKRDVRCINPTSVRFAKRRHWVILTA